MGGVCEVGGMLEEGCEEEGKADFDASSVEVFVVSEALGEETAGDG